MKIRKYIVLFLTLLVLLSFSACKNDPIFAAIEQEVKLKKFSAIGNIVGFAQIGDDLFVANSERVFTKKRGSSGSWSSVGAPGSIILKLASDGKSLFASFNEGGAYYYKKGSWHKVSGAGSIQAVFGDTTIFGYDGSKVFKVTESGLTGIKSVSSYLVGASGNYFATTDGFYSVSGTTATEVKSAPSNIKAMCSGPNNKVFILAGSSVYQYDGSKFSSKLVSGADPLSIFYFKDKEMILIGCTKKYAEFKLKNNSIADATQISLGSSKSTTPSDVFSQFNSTIGKFSLNPIFAVSNKAGTGYSVFAGVSAGHLTKNTGLWAYHSFAKQEWNRD